jgi:hypothetical protein
LQPKICNIAGRCCPANTGIVNEDSSLDRIHSTLVPHTPIVPHDNF